MGAVKEIPIGSVFGEWVVYGNASSRAKNSGRRKERFYPVRCSCGLEKEVRTNDLLRGSSTSCKFCSGRKDIPIGSRFGHWEVIGLPLPDVDQKTRSVLFPCRCDCGTEEIIRSTALRTGQRTKCKSCKNAALQNHASSGEVHGTYIARIWDSVEKRSKLIKVEITAEDLDAQWQDQRGLCALSGKPLTLARGSNDSTATASVDRIDSNGNYSPKNIQWVHKIVNKMKNDLIEEEFFLWCRLIVENKDQTKKLREGRRPWIKSQD